MAVLSNINSFFNSNSLMSKITFLIIVVFVFLMFIHLGTMVIKSLYKSDGSPILLNGMIDAKNEIVIPQNPSDIRSITIRRSTNESEGIEFTWSVWVYINNLQYLPDKYKNIFYKGSSQDPSTIGTNSPGLYIAPNTNALVVIMNTFTVMNEEINIPNIPLNKWVNVIIRCQNTKLDVFINGTITRSLQLSGVPKQNFGDVMIASNGGFDGYISSLRYFNYALGTLEISNIISEGPNTTIIGDNNVNNKLAKYLSLRWYFYGSGDTYNP